MGKGCRLFAVEALALAVGDSAPQGVLLNPRLCRLEVTVAIQAPDCTIRGSALVN
jgi:hypothetical protein